METKDDKSRLRTREGSAAKLKGDKYAGGGLLVKGRAKCGKGKVCAMMRRMLSDSRKVRGARVGLELAAPTLGPPSRSVVVYRVGEKLMALNFCPWCGAGASE